MNQGSREFRDRYKAEGIYNERYLYNCLKYIYDNPVKAGMCEKAEDYPYSNYKKIEEKLDETYKFMDVEEDNKKITEDIIKRFLKENNMELPALKKDKTKLKELIIILKEKHEISLRNIAKAINLSRETVRNLYNE